MSPLPRGSRRGFTLVELMMTVTITGVLAGLATHSVRGHMAASKSLEAVSTLTAVSSSVITTAHELTDRLQMGRSIAFGPPGGGPKNDVDGDGNHGHGNNEDKCDPSNPGNGKWKCAGSEEPVAEAPEEEPIASEEPIAEDGCVLIPEELRLCGGAEPVPSSLEQVRGTSHRSSPEEWRSGDNYSGWNCLRFSKMEPQNYQYGYDIGAAKVSGDEGAEPESKAFTIWARGDLDGNGKTSWFTLEGAVVGGQIVIAPGVSVTDPGE